MQVFVTDTPMLRRLILCALATIQFGFAASDPSGDWTGEMAAGAIKMRLALHVSKSADGTWTATFDSIDQGAMGLKLDSFSFEQGKVRFELKVAGAEYEGELSGDGAQIVGTLKQAGGAFPVTFRRGTVAPIVRPQEPKPPYPYREVEAAYESRQKGIKLAGTLTVPEGRGPFPAAILITGSGAQDRNESLLGHKPFLVIADRLTRAGIAVLRVDDRGVGGSTGSVQESTSADFAQDVLAGVDWLKDRPEVDKKRIGVIGHSEGGIVGPLASTLSKDVAFVVMLAGTGVTGEEILYEQSALIANAQGFSDADVAEQRKHSTRIYAILKSGKPDAEMKADLEQVYTEIYDSLPEASKAQFGSAKALADASTGTMLTPWFRYFLTYDPRVALRKVTAPVLALNGSLDLQVPVAQNFPEIRKALEAAGNKDVTLIELPGLNHLFQTTKTGSPSEYGTIDETFSEGAIAEIVKWILFRFSTK
jgi:pimeloyl-ACP methyl ester carboxylesterase